MKKKKLLLGLLATAACFVFSAGYSQAAGPTKITKYITEPTVWTKDGSPYLVMGDIGVQADLTIEPGVVVKLKDGDGGLTFSKKLTAVGTEDEKIIFTSARDDSFGGDTNEDGNATKPSPGSWNALNLSGGGASEIIINHASVLYGSVNNIVMGAVTVNSNNNVTIKNTEIKYSGEFGLYIYQAQPTVENNIISNNETGVYVWNQPGKVAVIKNNSITDNAIRGASVYGYVYNENYVVLDARDNWWGDKSGPYYKHYIYGTDNLAGKGNAIGDGVKYNPWLVRDLNQKRNPVILIPGIGAAVNPDLMIGSIANDNWTLLSHTYDGIIEAFESMGYEDGKDFFICYYDWRNKNEDSAEDYLKPLIKRANSINGTSKTNIIAHSMGGLVARSYIQSSGYDNDVENLFLIGAPNKGSSDVYPVWEGGYIPKYWENKIVMILYLNYLKFKNYPSSHYETIHQFIPSVKQLMPVYNYIYPKSEPQNIKDYSAMSEVNDYLEDLNDYIQKLNDRVKVHIISGNNQDTVNSIPVVDSDEDPLWADGKPDPVNPEQNDSAGDGRVLLSSSQIQSLYSDILDDNHGEIVSQSEPLIAERINEYLDVLYPAPQINDEIAIWVASPVDIEAKDPEGKIISKDENQIPLAKYASESKPDGFKMISIPNPIDGEYEINLSANGDGEFHIGLEYSDYTGEKKDHSSILQGSVTTGDLKEYVANYNSQAENPVEDIRPKDETPPTIGIISPENDKNYLNDQILPINYAAEDDITPPDKIISETYYDGNKFTASEIDLSLENLGDHKIKITAQDEAKNPAEKTAEFAITADISAIIDNARHYYDSGLIKNEKDKKFLENQLRILEKNLALLEKIKKNDKIKPRAKRELTELFEKLANRHIDLLVKLIETNRRNAFAEKAQELLIESLDFIRPR